MKSSLRRLNVSLLGAMIALVVVALLSAPLRMFSWIPQPAPARAPSGDPRNPQRLMSFAHQAQRPGAASSGSNGEMPSARNGQRLILTSIHQLTHGATVSARVHERVEYMDGDVLGVGAYLQEPAAAGGRFHLQLRTKGGALVAVSDGNHVWRQLAIGELRRITRVDLVEFQRLSGAAWPPASPHPRQRRQPTSPVSPLQLGGLPRLLRSLVDSYSFSQAQERTHSNARVYELTGERRATVAAPARAQFPGRVTVRLGREDLFPYHIVFEWPQASGQDHENGVPKRIAIQFSDVRFGAPLDNRWFEYAPPRDVAWEDITSESAAIWARAS
jgi:hypothetical protein